MNRCLSTALCCSLMAHRVDGQTSPANGDTTGYWQQRVHYAIEATLDEPNHRVRAHGTLTYVNNSPDTLREMFFHQYLNAFRPGSRWSAVDEREGRERFQHLREPDYGYERFTAPVRVNGTAVTVVYPGSPDSTIVQIALPAPLAPGDSVEVAFAWDARPSTVPRRQGRRGRSYDFAQWYPKVAVYDRGGWEPNALQPAGEFYGEFGTYDVTLILPRDQVVGATGVPIAGDPGWTAVFRGGVEYRHDGAYRIRARDLPETPAGFKAVRFLARDVHHFAWSVSPDYRYEGGVYVRRVPPQRWQTWDTVSVHVLYRPGDDTTWAGGRVLRRTLVALQWLEALYGPYAYPQMTVLHRIDGGSTEFPMMQMNGSYSQGLILHEGGHIWTYGVLANNEWQSGWMDEGLTSFQTDWAQAFLPQERARLGIRDSVLPMPGYRSLGHPMVLPRFELLSVNQFTRDLKHAAQPIATPAARFHDFDTYNDITYDRAQIMFGQLRDVLGDSVFVAFLRDYYARWALKHVDERAMRAAAERVSGQDLGWFFDQWLHRTGVMDYALARVRTRDSSGVWITNATVRRRGSYLHPMIVGARTSQGWTFARVSADSVREQVVRLVTSEKPAEVRLDPFHFTWDWDRRDDRRYGWWKGPNRYAIDWPFLDQADRDLNMVLFRPAVWYSSLTGANVGLHEAFSYLGWLDSGYVDVIRGTRNCGSTTYECTGAWFTIANPVQGLGRKAIGWTIGGGFLDDVSFGRITKSSTRTVGATSTSLSGTLTASSPDENSLAIPELWQSSAVDLDFHGTHRRAFPDDSYHFYEWRAIVGLRDDAGPGRQAGYGKIELDAGRVFALGMSTTFGGRLYYGQQTKAPPQRGLYLSAADPVSTFANHHWRSRGALLKQEINGLPLGGAGLRGVHWSVDAIRLTGANVDLSRRVATVESNALALQLSLSAFGDGAFRAMRAGSFGNWITDGGVGLRFKGRLYDQPFDFRIDSPFFVSEPALGIDPRASSTRRVAPRWTLVFRDLW